MTPLNVTLYIDGVETKLKPKEDVMKTQQETFEIKLFIHANSSGVGYTVLTTDFTSHGYALLGTQTVALNVPTKDPVEAEIEMLDKKEASLIKDHLAALHAIQCRKNDLLCIENNGEQ